MHRLPQPAERARHIGQEAAQHLGHGVGRAAVFDDLHAQAVFAHLQRVGDVPAEAVPDAPMHADRRVVHEAPRLITRAAEVQPLARPRFGRRWERAQVVAGSFERARDAVVFPRAGHAHGDAVAVPRQRPVGYGHGARVQQRATVGTHWYVLRRPHAPLSVPGCREGTR
jgi:hypothetical protein